MSTSGRGEESGRPSPPAVGDRVTLDLVSLGHGGAAIGRLGGFVHFVPFGAPGDRVEAEVVEAHRSFARSRLVRIVEPSPDRVDPPCPIFGTCGGCHLQHLSRAAQLASRRSVLRDALERIARVRDPEVLETVSGERALGYRHRITLHAQGGLERGGDADHVEVGFVDVTKGFLVPVAGCPIAHERFQPVIAALARASGEVHRAHGRIDLRTGFPARDVHVHLGTGAETFASPLLRALQEGDAIDGVTIFYREDGVTKCIPRARPAPLRLVTPWATWKLPPGAFYQTDPSLAIRIAETVREWASPSPGELAADLYAGVGFFGAAIARDAKRVHCIERFGSSVRSGEAAMRRAGIENVRFIPGRVEEKFASMNVKGSLGVAIADPPREGLSRAVVHVLGRHAPARVVYVSCEPSTLARDVKWLVANGYRHRRSVPFDLFPQTYHFESVTLLERA